MPKRKAHIHPDHWQQSILEYIADHPERPTKPRAIARALGVDEGEYPAFRNAYRQLRQDGRLGARRNAELEIEGRFSRARGGFGFIERPGHEDVFVRRHNTAGALDGDRVRARIGRPGRRGDLTAVVVEIIDRVEAAWVGPIELLGRTWIVRPLGRKPLPPLEIVDARVKNVSPGDMVVVEPIEATLATHRPKGVIIESLGEPSATRTKILAVARHHSLPDRFDESVRAEARAAAQSFRPRAGKSRRDLRKLLTLTIDPDDARDFDDAITLERLRGGNIRLGVHIADVAYFVRPDSRLDEAAYERGNSVYLPGHVIPMLPETLSNGVCSLQPDEDRYVKSAFITYDRSGKVRDTEIVNGIIRSDARLTYDQATRVLDGETVDGLSAKVVAQLRDMDQLARTIRKRRLDDGMLVLSVPEVDIVLDDEEHVIDARPADTSFSHTIIEMFMVEANEAVSRTLRNRNVAHLRRIHPPPSKDVQQTLLRLQTILGRTLPKTLNRTLLREILEVVRDKPEESAVNFVLLRCLAPANYAPDEEGHFALASEDYCHFTSPIRRYPDLVVHRLLQAHIVGTKRSTGAHTYPRDELHEIGTHTSFTERRAQEAERNADTLLLLELMKDKVGETFPGIVTGVISKGVFVQIRPHLAEGLVHVSDLGPDRWNFDSTRGVLAGQRTGKVFAIGTRMHVQVASVDLQRMELNFIAAAPPNKRGKPSRSLQRPSRQSRNAGKQMSADRRKKSAPSSRKTRAASEPTEKRRSNRTAGKRSAAKKSRGKRRRK